MLQYPGGETRRLRGNFASGGKKKKKKKRTVPMFIPSKPLYKSGNPL